MYFVQMITRVHRTFDPATVYNFHTVKVSKFSRNWTLLVFALELSSDAASPDAFDALNMYWNSGQTLGGLPTAPYGYLADALLITPNGEYVHRVTYASGHLHVGILWNATVQ